MFEFIGFVAIFAGGYVVSIFTWPWLRLKLIGGEAEYQKLKARIESIKLG
jgi:hypothetical protein